MTLTCISRSSDFYTFYVNVPLSLGCVIRKVSAEDIAIRGNGTGLEYMCPTRHFVLIFFNQVFQLSTAKKEINLFNNHILIVAPVTCPSRCDDAFRGILVFCCFFFKSNPVHILYQLLGLKVYPLHKVQIYLSLHRTHLSEYSW